MVNISIDVAHAIRPGSFCTSPVWTALRGSGFCGPEGSSRQALGECDRLIHPTWMDGRSGRDTCCGLFFQQVPSTCQPCLG